MTDPLDDARAVWSAYCAAGPSFYASGPTGRTPAGDGWHAFLSGESHSELNVCTLLPGAGATAARELVTAIDEADVPATVFVSEHAAPAAGEVLAAAGFATAVVVEPLMRSAAPPAPVETTLGIEPMRSDELAHALSLVAGAHHVDHAMVERTLTAAARDETTHVWLAWDGTEPVSVVWLCCRGRHLGVREMMTPKRHQRRGAGRALLTTALAAEWTPATEFACLVATPAGRRLYESIGFVVVDRVTTRFRGVDPGVLEAIGQPG